MQAIYRKDDNFSYFGIWIDFVTTLNRLFGNNIWQLISKPFLPYLTRHFLVQSDTNKLFNSFIHKFRKQAILNEYLPHARLTRLFILFSLSLYSAYYLTFTTDQACSMFLITFVLFLKTEHPTNFLYVYFTYNSYWSWVSEIYS